MKGTKKLTSDEKKSIAEEYLNGDESQLQVAAKHKITMTTFTKLLKEHKEKIKIL